MGSPKLDLLLDLRPEVSEPLPGPNLSCSFQPRIAIWRTEGGSGYVHMNAYAAEAVLGLSGAPSI